MSTFLYSFLFIRLDIALKFNFFYFAFHFSFIFFVCYCSCSVKLLRCLSKFEMGFFDHINIWWTKLYFVLTSSLLLNSESLIPVVGSQFLGVVISFKQQTALGYNENTLKFIYWPFRLMIGLFNNSWVLGLSLTFDIHT